MSLEAEVESPIARIKYPDVKTFKELIVALSKILDEAKLSLTRTGLRIVGMDPAKVAYIEVHMPREAFLEYEIEEDREVVEAGFNLGVLEDILEGRKGNPVEMVIAQDKVLVSVEGAVIRRFLLPNLEVAVEELGEVELEHDVEAVVISDVLKKAISDIKAVSDIVEIEADENQIVLRSTGEAGPKVTLRLTRESSALIDLEARNPSRAKYDVSYLENTLDLCKVAESVELMFSTDKPLELNFKSPDGSTVRYILAPSAA
ncbi:MAG: DNA polymerase sliding clamp [Acidilobaceae archaeon]